MIADAGMLQTVHWITRSVALAGMAAIEGNWP